MLVVGQRRDEQGAPGAVVVIGNLDGVHRGHQTVLREARARADREGLSACVLTFHPHPAAILGRTPPPLLTTLERRADLIDAAGVPLTIAWPFDEAFAALSPESFVEEVLVRSLRAKVVVVGDNFRFGAHAAGDRKLIEELGKKHGFVATTQPLAGDAKGPFSSTRVRAAVAAGDLAEATNVLGREHELSGVVAHGKKLGRQLGWPTANLEGVAEMLPPDGIYACWVDDATTGARIAAGALSIGVRPTVGDGLARTVEVYLLDFDGDLYGRALRLALVERLRGEERFSGLDELKSRIRMDVEDVRSRLHGRLRKGP